MVAAQANQDEQGIHFVMVSNFGIQGAQTVPNIQEDEISCPEAVLCRLNWRHFEMFSFVHHAID
ncbi:MAG TPA: hypothetical protein DCS71_04790 [Flavobacteriales bacterium]|nr:hypothetical protein [Flavobacteriales bacterium]|tara:strand:- start:209 stop:400 length:192 start_codon:yes stop_codon:yes gene_type:complete